MTFTLAPLPYGDTELEPFITAETFSFHHGKHHKTYVDNLNNLLPNCDMSLEDVIKDASGDASKVGVFNNAAQIWNHDFYWQSMGVPNSENVGGTPPKEINDMINDSFGSFENFVKEFTEAGKTQFGSGWVWLVSENGKLKILKTGNAFTPLTDDKYKPLLTMDVWEHAYYIDYRNARPNYISTFIEKLINWNFVAANLK